MTATAIDNGSNICAATEQSDVLGIRLYCFCHGLNLTVQNGLRLWKKDEKQQDALIKSTR